MAILRAGITQSWGVTGGSLVFSRQPALSPLIMLLSKVFNHCLLSYTTITFHIQSKRMLQIGICRKNTWTAVVLIELRVYMHQGVLKMWTALPGDPYPEYWSLWAISLVIISHISGPPHAYRPNTSGRPPSSGSILLHLSLCASGASSHSSACLQATGDWGWETGDAPTICPAVIVLFCSK